MLSVDEPIVLLPDEIVERAVDVALQRICCGGDDNFPEHCLEVFWYAVSRQPWAAKYVIGNDVRFYYSVILFLLFLWCVTSLICMLCMFLGNSTGPPCLIYYQAS